MIKNKKEVNIDICSNYLLEGSQRETGKESKEYIGSGLAATDER